MNYQQTAGIALIAGFVLILIASFLGPPRVYQEPDSGARLQIIADYPARWAGSNVFFALGGLFSAAGLILFALQARPSANGLLITLGAGLFVLGTILYAIFLYQRTVNPAALFENYTFSPFTVILLASLVLGLLLLGVVYLQAGYPVWPGVGLIGGMALIGLAALFFPASFFASFPPQVLYLFTLLLGVVLVQR